MKKLLLLLFCLSATIATFAQMPGNNQCVDQFFRCNPFCDAYTAQSFIFTRPVYRNIAAQQANGWHDAVFEKPGCFLGSFQALGIYQETFRTSNIARYFLVNRKQTITIKGDLVTTDSINRDVRAEWLQLPGTFDGTLTLRPQQRQAGIWLEYNQDLKKFLCHPFFEPWWIAIAFPIQIIENDLRPTGSAEAVAAFNRANLDFGRIDGKRKKTGLGEITLKLGTTFMARDGFQIAAYSGIVIPTGRGQSARFMFDPFVGNNGHFGVIQAVQFQLPLNCDTDCQLFALFFNVENIYFVRNFQQRILDLKDKPWSRFMLYNKRDGTTNIPGVNLFTQNVKVRPFNMVDLSAGFRYQNNFIEIEIGYDLWAHGDETLTLDCEFPQFDFGIAGTLPGTTASKSTIEFQAPNDTNPDGSPKFVPVVPEDIDIWSGSARAALTNRIHGAIGSSYCAESFGIFFGIGGFAEFPQKNAAFNNWGIWGKLGATF